MKRKNLPAWQQVLLVALRNVPEAENGHDAWAKLNEEEKSAVNDYLIEHCGDEAQAKLEETCSIAKFEGSEWRGVTVWLLIMAVVIAGCVYVDKCLDKNASMIFWTFYSLNRIIDDITGARRSKMEEVWKHREQTQTGVSAALEKMEEVVFRPRRELCKDGWTIFHGIMLLISAVLATYELLS